MYKVIKSKNLESFSDEVRKEMANGWKCQGGMIVEKEKDNDGNETSIFYQSLVKEETSDKQVL